MARSHIKAKSKSRSGNTLLIANIMLMIVIAIVLWFLLMKSQQSASPSISIQGLSQTDLKEIADLQTQLALEKAQLQQLAEQRRAEQLTKELAAEKQRAAILIAAQSGDDQGLATELNAQLEQEKKKIAQMAQSQQQTSAENALLQKELEQTRDQQQALNQQIQNLMGQLMQEASLSGGADNPNSSLSQENLDLLNAVQGDLSAFTNQQAQQQVAIGGDIPSAAYQLQAVVDNLNTVAIEDSQDVDKIPSAVYQLQAVVSDIVQTDQSNSNLATLATLVNDSQDNAQYIQALEQEAEVRQNEMRFIAVRKGDTLSIIARRAYGDPSLYKKIFDANPNVLVSPDKIKPGMRLRVPL